MNISKYSQRLTSVLAAGVLSFLATQAGAAPLAISDVPLFLSTGVEPNLIMAIDDSGSMDFELLLRGNDGAAWWRTATASGNCTSSTGNSFAGCVSDGTTDQPGAGQLNFNNGGNSSSTWKKFAYLFPNGSGGNTSDQRRLADSTNDHFAIPPLPAFAWSRSPDFNTAYFDPTVTYTPWVNGGGFTFADKPSTAAPFDPVYTGYGTINLTRDFAGTGGVDLTASCGNATMPGVNTNYYFRVFTGMTIPSGACVRVSSRTGWETVRTGDCQVGVTNGCLTTLGGVDQTYTLSSNSSVAIRYFPATFYLSAANAPPASYGYSATPAASGLAPDGSTLYQYEIKPGNFSTTALYDAAIQNFANWFSYYRKRHQALRAGLGSAFNTLQSTRVAGFTINQSGTYTSPDVTMADINVASNRTALYKNFYQTWTGSGGTPNRAAVANLVRNYKRTDGNAPIAYSCQRNFGMLFTDGFSNPPTSGDGITTSNVDGGKGNPYQDSVSNTLADHVMDAYTNSLRTDSAIKQGKVTVPSACAVVNHDPRLDCNTNPHLNFYAITLGTRGLQFDPDNPVDPYVTTPTWPTTFPQRHPSAVDDLWHATINGRGQLLNARSSSELADKLSAVLRSIIDKSGSASSAAVNSGSINVESRLFQASFDSKDWSGKLVARDVNADGTLDSEVDATIPTSRNITTVDDSGKGVAFTWADIGTTRQGQLQPSDTFGSARVDYLRGARTDEQPTGKFRKRNDSTVLGDIINSAPAFVGSPPYRYSDTLESKPYSKFRSDHLSRQHMVYAGANDGMLHGFATNDAVSSDKTVTEAFAFVPGGVFENLYRLTDPAYSHMYYVDGTPTTGDAFVDGDWHTMLVAGLNKGGQSIFALDITNPSDLTESNAATVFKWEFTDANDKDLGYTYSRPQIVRMANGKWVAIFGNGYNNTAPDNHVSTTGDAVLYVVDLSDGSKIATIDTGIGMSKDPAGLNRPNGLSTPVLVDVTGDDIIDYGYAGDMFGNLWKFDFTAKDPASWVVAYSGAPLFVAKDSVGTAQAITTRPNVSRGPNGVGLVVLFGTGKYLEPSDSDVSKLKTQSFYGLLDPNSGTSTDLITGRSALVQQTITNEVYGATFGSGTPGDPQVTANVRVTSKNVQTTTSRGWYLDLLSPLGFQGEMQVTDSLIRNGHIVFTTLVPNVDPCEFGGTSWLMEMNLFTGSRLDNTPFDINNNGKFDDLITIGGVKYPISGLQTSVGITPKPTPISGEKCDYLVFPGTTGGTETRCRDPGPRGFGRQSWRQSR